MSSRGFALSAFALWGRADPLRCLRRIGPFYSRQPFSPSALQDSAGTEAFRWEAGVMEGLGYLTPGVQESEAYAVSEDGSVVVGGSGDPGAQRAFRWQGGVMTDLGIAGSDV